MVWHIVTLPTGKTSLIDFSKVLYVSESATGTTLYFQVALPDPDGKLKLKTINVKEPIDTFVKALKARGIF